jgi:hypothetical protein
VEVKKKIRGSEEERGGCKIASASEENTHRRSIEVPQLNAAAR